MLAAAHLVACDDNQTFVPAPDAYVPDSGSPLSCVPNLDGRIDSGELTPALGVPSNFLITAPGTTVTIDPVGVVNAEGKREWDFSASQDDLSGTFEARAIEGLWYADDFPAGEFAVQLEAGGDIEGIYSHDEDGLWLHGLASVTAAGNTLVVYDQAVQLYRFPLELGDEWVTVGESSNAQLRGLPYAGKDTYRIEVVDAGLLMLPDLTFTQALRVRTEVTAQPVAGATVSRRQQSWLFECFGEVQRATSQDGESNPDFTVAAQLRRLGL